MSDDLVKRADEALATLARETAETLTEKADALNAGYAYGDEWKVFIPLSDAEELCRSVPAMRDRIEADAKRIAELEAQNKSLGDLVHKRGNDLAWERRKNKKAEARVRELEDANARLRAALIDHNDLLRSAFQIAKREGVDGLTASTNWDAYYNRVAVVLKKHHEISNQARAALEGEK